MDILVEIWDCFTSIFSNTLTFSGYTFAWIDLVKLIFGALLGIVVIKMLLNLTSY